MRGRLRILAAAIHHDDGNEYPHPPRNLTTGITVAGWRHHNCFTAISLLFPDRDQSKDVQGFIASDGNFYDRVESARIAYEAGQYRDYAGIGDELVSEVVW
jgi:hypothetical protein